MPTGENVNNDNPKTEIKYVTKDEFMEKLRKSKRSYITQMQDDIRKDMQVISELNSRAVSAKNPIMAAMFVTVAAELADSIKLRTGVLVDYKLFTSIYKGDAITVDGKTVNGLYNGLNSSSESTKTTYFIKLKRLMANADRTLRFTLTVSG